MGAIAEKTHHLGLTKHDRTHNMPILLGLVVWADEIRKSPVPQETWFHAM